MRLRELLDMSVVRKLAEANFKASGMPIGLIDAVDGEVLVGFGWQDICTMYHRVHPVTVERCRESDRHIEEHLTPGVPVEYTCRNGLRDIALPIVVEGRHLATMFLGQFFYAGEAPGRDFFVQQARQFGFDEASYLAALERVPVFPRSFVENTLAYDTALASFIADLAEGALRRRRAEAHAESIARLPRENPDPVLRLAGDLSIAYANDAARVALAGLGVAEGARAPDELARLAARALAEHGRVDGEISTGAQIFSLSAVSVGDGVNVYGHDVTRRKEMEQELREASRAKDDFLGMLSHELRNPLAPIRNALYILDHTEASDPAARRAKEVAGRQLTHLARLVDDLLDVTRIVRGKVELRRSHLDLAELTRRIGEDHRALMRERGLGFDVDTPPEPVWVDGDETRLAQVVGNLLQNAAKFTPDGGRVSVSVQPVPGAVEVCVRDTGAGVEAGLLGDIFNPFVQGKQSLARTEGGLGLGLALAKGLVEVHGGRVTAASAGQGRGAAFTVWLPVVAHAGASADAPGPPEPRPPCPLRVLVVDDNRDAAESLADLVRLLGHEAEVAFDGGSAVRMVRSDPPDLVLCDIGLPGMSGYQVAQALRADERFDAVQLIAISGYAQPEDRERALAAGFAAHLAKPADPAQVLRLLAGRPTPST